MAGGPTKLNQEQREMRDSLIWEMRTSRGWTLELIGESMDMPISTVHACLVRSRKRYRDANLADVGAIVADEAAALDRAIERLSMIAEDGEPWAYAQLLKYRESRRKLLGADQPEQLKVEVSGTVTSPVDDEMAELARELQLNDPTVSAERPLTTQEA